MPSTGADAIGPYSDRAGGDAAEIGFLDDCGQRLLGHPEGFQKAREVAENTAKDVRDELRRETSSLAGQIGATYRQMHVLQNRLDALERKS